MKKTEFYRDVLSEEIAEIGVAIILGLEPENEFIARNMQVIDEFFKKKYGHLDSIKINPIIYH